MAGELKILGYSAYLHPIADDLLLGVGQDASERGALPRHAALAVRRVRPCSTAAPAPASVGANSSSTAEYDYHAFLWWAPAKLAVMPLHVLHGVAAGRVQRRDRLRVDRAGRDLEAGRASHDADAERYPWPIERTFVASGEAVHAVRARPPQHNSLADLSQQGWVGFPR